MKNAARYTEITRFEFGSYRVIFEDGEIKLFGDMLTKCLRELEADGLVSRTQYSTIPSTVEYALTERGKTLIPALESVYSWADQQMKAKETE